MKSTSLKQNRTESFLKVVKNTTNIKRNLKSQVNRIYINTLIPNFSYTNNNGEIIAPKKCALL